MSQNVCSFCGNYHDSVTSACPVSQQQKGETMPTFEKPPTLTFDGTGYHCARCGSSQVALCEHWKVLFEHAHSVIELGRRPPAASEDKFEHVCDLCGASFTGPKHQCAASNMQPPEVSHYKYRAGRGYLEPIMQPSSAGQPDEYGRGRLQGLYEAADALRGAQRYNKKEWNDWVCTIANEIDGLRTKPSGFDYLANEVNAALEKLRELEVKWRSPEWAKAYMNDDRPSEFICADELHEIIAPAPRLIEKD